MMTVMMMIINMMIMTLKKMMIILIMLQGVANLEEAKSNVLGGEVALWTEQADGFSMMSRCVLDQLSILQNQ